MSYQSRIKQYKTLAARQADIRRRHAAGESQASIARHYGISRQRVHQIINGEKK